MNANELIGMLEKLPEEYRNIEIYSGWSSNPISSVELDDSPPYRGLILSSRNNFQSFDHMMAELKMRFEERSSISETLRKAETDGILEDTAENGREPYWFDEEDVVGLVTMLSGQHYDSYDRILYISDGELKKSVAEALDIYMNRRMKKLNRKHKMDMTFSDFSHSAVVMKLDIDLEAEYDEEKRAIRFKSTDTFTPKEKEVDGHRTYVVKNSYEWTLEFHTESTDTAESDDRHDED